MTILFFPVLIGLPMVIVGLACLRFPPKKINHFYGYRSSQACRDQDSWDFAQRYAAWLMIILELCCTVICGCIYFAVHSFNIEMRSEIVPGVYYALLAIGVLMGMPLTEISLAKLEKIKLHHETNGKNKHFPPPENNHA